MLVAAVSVVAAGCGGGEDLAGTLTSTPSDTAQQQTVADPGAAAATGEETPGINEISGADAAVGSSVTVSSRTPKDFSKAHCTKPIVVLLYQPGAILDKALLTAARTGITSSKADDVVFLRYTPSQVKAMGDLPSKLGLLSAPGIAVVGRNGTIENFWTTYVDDALIARSIQNAAATKPCKVSTNDVPAAGTSSLADAATVANGGTVSNTTTDPLAGTPPATPTVDAAGATTGTPMP
jgi:hypothetical protein